MIGCEVYPSFYVYSEPVARKQHPCCECSAPILKGEKHFKWTGQWDGCISTGRQHALCCEACMCIRDKIEGDCISFGGLRDYYGEYRCDLLSAHAKPGVTKFLRLYFKIKKRERSFRRGHKNP